MTGHRNQEDSPQRSPLLVGDCAHSLCNRVWAGFWSYDGQRENNAGPEVLVLYRKRESASRTHDHGVFARFRYNDLKEAAGDCGRCGLMAMGIQSFYPICKILVLQYLENGHVREPQFDALRPGHDVRRIARAASAAPAASFKSRSRKCPGGNRTRAC